MSEPADSSEPTEVVEVVQTTIEPPEPPPAKVESPELGVRVQMTRRRDIVDDLWDRLLVNATTLIEADALDAVLEALAQQQSARWLPYIEAQGAVVLIPDDFDRAVQYLRAAPETLSPGRARQLPGQMSAAVQRFNSDGRSRESIVDFVTEGSKIGEDIRARSRLATAAFGFLRPEGVTGVGAALTWGVQADIISASADPQLTAFGVVAYIEQLRGIVAYLGATTPGDVSPDGDATLRRTTVTALNNSVVYLTEVQTVDGDDAEVRTVIGDLLHAAILLATEPVGPMFDGAALAGQLVGLDEHDDELDPQIVSAIETMTSTPLAIRLLCDDIVTAALSTVAGLTLGAAGDVDKAATRFFNAGISLLRENQSPRSGPITPTHRLETATYACSLLWSLAAGQLDLVAYGVSNSAAFNLVIQLRDDPELLGHDSAPPVVWSLQELIIQQDPTGAGRVYRALAALDMSERSEVTELGLSDALTNLIVRTIELVDPDRPDDFEPPDGSDPGLASLSVARAMCGFADLGPVNRYLLAAAQSRLAGPEVKAVLTELFERSLEGSLASVDNGSHRPAPLEVGIGRMIAQAVGATSAEEAWEYGQAALRERTIVEFAEAIEVYASTV